MNKILNSKYTPLYHFNFYHFLVFTIPEKMNKIDFNYSVVSADEIIPGLWLGNEAASQSESFINNNNIKLIVNASKNINSKFLNLIHYLRVPIDDPGAVYTCSQNTEVRALRSMLPLILEKIKLFREKGMNVFIHCHAGAQRSAAICAAYLIYRGYASNTAAAVEFIVRKRPIAFYGGKHVHFRDALLIL